MARQSTMGERSPKASASSAGRGSAGINKALDTAASNIERARSLLAKQGATTASGNAGAGERRRAGTGRQAA